MTVIDLHATPRQRPAVPVNTGTVPPIETIERRRDVHADEFVRLDADRVRFHDGREGTYNVITPANGLGVMAIPRYVCDGTTYYGLVEQYRYPLGRTSLEFPGGGAGSLTAEEARRKLVEETGIFAHQMHRLGSVHPNTGLLACEVGVWVADVARPVGEHTDVETGGKTRWVSHAGLLEHITSGQITCGVTLSAFALMAASALTESAAVA